LIAKSQTGESAFASSLPEDIEVATSAISACSNGDCGGVSTGFSAFDVIKHLANRQEAVH